MPLHDLKLGFLLVYVGILSSICLLVMSMRDRDNRCLEIPSLPDNLRGSPNVHWRPAPWSQLCHNGGCWNGRVQSNNNALQSILVHASRYVISYSTCLFGILFYMVCIDPNNMGAQQMWLMYLSSLFMWLLLPQKKVKFAFAVIVFHIFKCQK